MPIVTTLAEKAGPIDPITLDQSDAERLTGLSYKTLERAALAGEPVGRIKCGRRVLFVKSVLEK